MVHKKSYWKIILFNENLYYKFFFIFRKEYLSCFDIRNFLSEKMRTRNVNCQRNIDSEFFFSKKFIFGFFVFFRRKIFQILNSCENITFSYTDQNLIFISINYSQCHRIDFFRNSITYHWKAFSTIWMYRIEYFLPFSCEFGHQGAPGWLLVKLHFQ